MDVSVVKPDPSCRVLRSGVFPDGIVHGFSTRVGGISTGPWESCNLHDKKGDDPANVRENRRRFLETLGLKAREIITVRQEHTNRVLDVDGLTAEECEREEADGMVTTRSGLVLGVTSADCLPVLLADVRGRGVAALHAGWRGLAAGILENGVMMLCEKAGVSPADIRAAVGVGIGPCCFEVGEEVREAFLSRGFPAEHFREEASRLKADLPALAAWALTRIGVGAVDVLPGCTFCQKDLFYSYRRDRWPTGLMMAVIAIAERPLPAESQVPAESPAPAPVSTTPPESQAPAESQVPAESQAPAGPTAPAPASMPPAASENTPGEQAPAAEVPMRESVMESVKNKNEKGAPEKKDTPPLENGPHPPSSAWDWLQAFLGTPWGRRTALALCGILLFLAGYVIGRWGRSDLESQLSDRSRDVVALKKQLEEKEAAREELARKNEKMEKELREIESRRHFSVNRDRVRKSLEDAQIAVQRGNFTAASEALHQAGVYLQKEAEQAQGLQAYLYHTVSLRLRETIQMAETQCAPAASMSVFDSTPVPATACRARLDEQLARIRQSLPAPNQE